MLERKPIDVQTFNDGICAVCSVENGAQRAYKPKESLSSKYPLLRYAELKVGIARFWNARQNNVSIDKVIRIARQPDISTQDIAILEDGMQYDILQVQSVKDAKPRCIDLSLQRRTHKYDNGPIP